MSDGLAGESEASPEEISSYYDTWADSGSYDDDVAGWGYQAPERVASMVAEHLDGRTGTVLDAGCGTGRAGAALRACGLNDLVGGDFTSASVQAASERGVYRTVDHLDLNAPLPFTDDTFSAAVSVGVFSYVTNTDATLRELLRVTEPAGVVIFTQRTDLWQPRGCDATIAQLTSEGLCHATISGHEPYLPGHPEFADSIGIFYVTLTVSG